MYEDIVERVRITFSIEGVDFPDILLTAEYLPHLKWAHRFKVAPAEYIQWIDRHKEQQKAYKPDTRLPKGFNTNKRKARKERPAKQEKIKREYSPDAYPIALFPTPGQALQLQAYGEAVRHGWNMALEFTKARHESTGQFVQTRDELYHRVMTMPKCNIAPSEAIQGVCHEVRRAVIVYCDTRKSETSRPFPTYREKRADGRYFVVNRVVLDRENQRIKVPKIGWIACEPLNRVPLDRNIKRTIVQQRTYSSWIIVLKTKENFS